MDLACGDGRHVVELSKRGFSVVGVDISEELVAGANSRIRELNLSASVRCADIRDITFENEFDVVLSLKDGAIGYFPDDHQNEQLFRRIASSLRIGTGRYFLEVLNAQFFAQVEPLKIWECSKDRIALSEFRWDFTTRRVSHKGKTFSFGDEVSSIDADDRAASYRLYSAAELIQILERNHLGRPKIYGTYHMQSEGMTDQRELIIVCHRA